MSRSVFVTDIVFQALGEMLQHTVANIMSKAVIDGLEVINI